MSLQSIMQLLGGVGLFLYAIKLISEALQRIAGDRLRQLIGALTKTPLLGVGVGALVTVLIQSSSATTVMTVSFVDAGLMTLNQAIGVIMGANIGTTVTGQILAFKVKDFAYLFVALGVLMSFFCRSRTLKYAGNGLFGFGLLFVGMQTMESAMSFLRDERDLFVAFSNHPLLGVLAGTLLTLLVQSSSATVGLTIALGMQGILPLEAAIPIILGDNIGTTITAALAAIGADRTARQACAAHILFNVIGVCIFLPLLPIYTPIIADTADSIGHQIANAHTLFNVCNTLLFLPFVGKFAQFIRTIIPDAPQRSTGGPQYLDRKLIRGTPVMAVEAVKNECVHMGYLAVDMLQQVRKIFFENDMSLETQVIDREEQLDAIYKAVKAYADEVSQTGLSYTASKSLSSYVKAAADVERMGDQCRKLVHFHSLRKSQEHDFSEQAMEELTNMFKEAQTAAMEAVEAFSRDDADASERIIPMAAHLRSMEMELRARHIQRMDRQECHPETGFLFVDVLGVMEHIGYHANSLAKITRTSLGEKAA